MRNFRQLEIWKEGMDLAVIAYELAGTLPREEQYGLKSQINRASVSVASNIAEGCSRSSQKEFKRFLEFSLGSSFEVETDFLLAERLGMIKQTDLVDFFLLLGKQQRKTNAFISRTRYL